MSSPDSSSSQSGSAKPLVRTQQVLQRLRDRLRRQILLHGFGSIALAFAAVLALAFVADRYLHVPRVVRLLFLGALFALPAWLALRELFAHLRNLPDRTGLALLVERHHPELHEVLSTAIETEGTEEIDPALRLRIAEEAERRAEDVTLDRVIDVRGPKQRAVAGFASLGLCAALLGLHSDTLSIFWQRLIGKEVSWPRATTLVIEIPLTQERSLQQGESEDGQVLTVRVARGTDVPVLVRAIGEVPDAVTLRFAGGHTTALAPSPSAGVFRTLLRSVQNDLSFYATGGDDRDEEPRVDILCLQPPDVSGLAIEVTPPPTLSFRAASPTTATSRCSRDRAFASPCVPTRPKLAVSRASSRRIAPSNSRKPSGPKTQKPKRPPPKLRTSARSASRSSLPRLCATASS